MKKIFVLLFLLMSKLVMCQITSPTQVVPITPRTLPALHVPFVDADFGTTVMKIADFTQVAGMTGNIGRSVRQDYAKKNPFNANKTKAVFRVIAQGGWVLYDATTWTPIRWLNTVQGEPEIEWSPTDPDTLYFIDRIWFKAYHPSTDTYVTLHAFTQCNFNADATAAYFAITDNDEGNLSQDGKRVAWICQKSGANDVIVYDIPSNTVVYEGALPQPFSNIDWLSISPSGKYFVILSNGIYTYDLTGALVGKETDNYGHADMGIDPNGDEVIVVDGSNDPHPYLDERWIIKYNLLNYTRTNLLALPSWSQSNHISLRNTLMPGWTLISTDKSTGTSCCNAINYNVVYPFDSEVFYLKTDGSGSVQRLAHHRSIRPDYDLGSPIDLNDYWNETHAVPSADGKSIIFASAWIVNGQPTDLENGGQSSPNAYLITLGTAPPAPTCIPNGSCSAATPACGQTTTGVDSCGNACSKTGPICPACVPNGTCAITAIPQCGLAVSGVNSCGSACSLTAPACPVCPTCSPSKNYTIKAVTTVTDVATGKVISTATSSANVKAP